jgi:hypothetical protein
MLALSKEFAQKDERTFVEATGDPLHRLVPSVA